MDTIDKKVRMLKLYDIYGSLLTNKQMQTLKLYLEEDYNLVEIAEIEEVSKQAIFDKINISINKLELYEKNLRILDSREEILAKIHELKGIVNDENMRAQDLKQRISSKLEEFEKIMSESI